MIEGADFRLAWHGAPAAGSGFDLGWKLAATNLSDVAAMGARPIGLTVALACPRDTSVESLATISRGLTAVRESSTPDCGVVGGDLSTAPVLTAAVTALGDMEGRAPVLRSTAQPGDAVAYTGQLGLSGVGLTLLFREGTDEGGVAHARTLAGQRERYPVAVAAQLVPTPPIYLGPLAATAGASAMMDVSDGLSLDAERMAEASGMSLAFESERLLSAFGEQGAQRVSVEAMMTGGEDHGLLACFPAGAALPAGFHEIGRVLEARGDDGVLLDGQPYKPRGWGPFGALPPGA